MFYVNKRYRKTTTALTTTPETTIAAAIHLSATPRSVALSVSTHGTPVVSTMSSSTIHGQQMLWASQKQREKSFCLMRILKASLLASMLIWDIRGLSILFVVGRSGFRCVRYFGTGGRGLWRVRIGWLGMLNCSVISSLTKSIERKY
jgi:hypothetical protein